MLKKIIICEVCKKEFEKNLKSTAKFCSRLCYKNRKKKEDKTYKLICKFCKKEFEHKNEKIQYCSHSCRGKALSPLIKVKKDHNKEKNPRWVGDKLLKICPFCKKEFRAKNYIQKYCSKLCWRSDLSLEMQNGKAALMNSKVKTISKPQLELYNLVKIIYPSVILEEVVYKFSIDMVIPEYKIAIEYDGSYWHKDKNYDNWRQTILEKEYSYKFIRYTDYIPTLEELNCDIKRAINE